MAPQNPDIPIIDTSIREGFDTARIDTAVREGFKPKVSEETTVAKQQDVERKAIVKRHLLAPSKLPDSLTEFNTLQSIGNPDYEPIEENEFNVNEYAQQLHKQNVDREVEDSITNSIDNADKSISDRAGDVRNNYANQLLPAFGQSAIEATRKVQGLLDAAIDDPDSLAQVFSTEGLFTALTSKALTGDFFPSAPSKSSELTDGAQNILDTIATSYEENSESSEAYKRTQQAITAQVGLGAKERTETTAKNIQSLAGDFFEDTDIEGMANVIEQVRSTYKNIEQGVRNPNIVRNVIEEEVGMMATGAMLGKLAAGSKFKSMSLEERTAFLADPKKVAKLAGTAGDVALLSSVLQESTSSADDARKAILALAEQDNAVDIFSNSPDYREYIKTMSHSEAVKAVASDVYGEVGKYTAMVAAVGGKVSGSGDFTGNLFTGLPIKQLSANTFGKVIKERLPNLTGKVKLPNGIAKSIDKVVDKIPSSIKTGAGAAKNLVSKVKTKAPATVKEASRGVISEGAEEAIMGVGSTVATNKALKDTVEPDKSLVEGVGAAVAQGVIAGSTLGGSAGAVKGGATDVVNIGKAVASSVKESVDAPNEPRRYKAETDTSSPDYNPQAAYSEVASVKTKKMSDEEYHAEIKKHSTLAEVDLRKDFARLEEVEGSGTEQEIEAVRAEVTEKLRVYKEANKRAATILPTEQPTNTQEDVADTATQASMLFTETTSKYNAELDSKEYSGFQAKAVDALRAVRDIYNSELSGNVNATTEAIFKGDATNMGITEYLGIIGTMAKSGTAADAKPFADSLRAFYDRHQIKLNAAKAITQAAKSNSPELAKLTQAYTATYGTKIDTPNRLRAFHNITQAIQSEVKGLGKANQAATALIKGMEGKSAAIAPTKPKVATETPVASGVSLDPTPTVTKTSEPVADKAEDVDSTPISERAPAEQIASIEDKLIKGEVVSSEELDIYVGDRDAKDVEGLQVRQLATEPNALKVQAAFDKRNATADPASVQRLIDNVSTKFPDELPALEKAVLGSEHEAIRSLVKREPVTTEQVLERVTKDSVPNILANFNEIAPEATPIQVAIARLTARVLTTSQTTIDVFDVNKKPSKDGAKLDTWLRANAAHSDFSKSPAIHNYNYESITLFPDVAQQADIPTVILHESIHAATAVTIDAIASVELGTPTVEQQVVYDNLTDAQLKGYVDLQEAHTSYRKWLAKATDTTPAMDYAGTNLHEFLAESLSNPEVMEQLKAIRGVKSKETLYTKVTRALAGLLGLKGAQRHSILANVLDSYVALVNGTEIQNAIAEPKLAFGDLANQVLTIRTPKGTVQTPKDVAEASLGSDIKADDNDFFYGTLSPIIDQIKSNFEQKSNHYPERLPANALKSEGINIFRKKKKPADDVAKYGEVFTHRAVTAMMHWYLTTGAVRSTNNDDRIKAMLGMSDTEFLDPSLRTQYATLGSRVEYVVDSLGRTILEANGISAKKSVSRADYERLVVSAGYAGLSALANTTIDGSTPLLYLDEHIEMDAYGTQLYPATNHGTGASKFVNMHRDSENYKEFSPELVSFLDQAKGVSIVTHLSDGIKDKTEGFYPSLDKAPKVSAVIRGGQTIVQGLVDKLQKYVDEPWFINEENNSLYFGMSKDNQEKLAGVKHDLSDVHIELEDGVTAKNEGLRRELAQMRGFNDHLVEQKQGNKGFFIGGFFAKNQRMHMSGAINPQTSKVARHLVKRRNWTQELSKDNTKQMALFAIAVSEAMGAKIANMTPADTKKKLQELLGSELNQIAMDAIAKQAQGEALSDDEQASIVEAVAKGKENLWSMDALVAMQAYRDSGDTFVTSLQREIDGINNGVILSLMQLGGASDITELMSLLNKGGIFTDESGISSYNEFKTKGLNSDDLYELLSRAILRDIAERKDPKLDAALSLLLGGKPATDENGALSKEARSISKSPVMTMVYGVSEDSMVSSLAESAINTLYESFTKEDTSTAIKLMESVEILTDGRVSLGDNVDLISRELTFSFEDRKDIEQSFDRAYRNPLVYGVSVALGTLLERRDAITMAMVHVQRKYNAVVKKDVTEQENKLGRLLSMEEIQEVETKYAEYSPHLQSFYGDSHESGVNLAPIHRGTPKAARNVVSVDGEASSERQDFPEMPYRTLSNEQSSLKTATATLKDITMDAVGVSAAPISAQIQDSAIASSVMSEQQGLLNVHDAYIVGIQDTDATGQEQNKATMNVVQNYDILGNLVALINKVNSELPALPDEKQVEFGNTVTSAIKETATEAANLKTELFATDLTVAQYSTMTPEGAYKHEGVDPAAEFAEDTVSGSLESNGDNFTDMAEPFVPTVDNEGIVVEGVNEVLFAVRDRSGQPFAYIAGNTVYNLSMEPIAKDVVDIDGFIRDTYNAALTKGYLGSADVSKIDYTLFNGASTAINKTNVVDLFDGLQNVGNVTEDTEHAGYLRSLVSGVFNGFIQPFNLHDTNNGTETMGVTSLEGDIWLQVGNGIPDTAINMSAQETITHEIVHDVLAEGISTSSGDTELLKKLWTKARAELDYTSFLGSDVLVDGSPEYLAAHKEAKARWDKVFNNIDTFTEQVKVGEATFTHVTNPYLHEFAAYGLTNKNFKASLGNLKLTKADLIKKSENLSLFDMIENLWNKVMGLLLHRVQTGDTVEASLSQLALRLAKKQEAHEGALWNKMDTLNKGSVDGVSAGVVAPIISFLKKDFKNETLNQVSDLIVMIPESTKSAWGINIRDVLARLRLYTNNIVGRAAIQAASDLSGEGLGTEVQHEGVERTRRLAKSQIDQTSQSIAANTAKALVKAFKAGVTPKQSIAIKRVALDADLSSIVQVAGETTLTGKYTLQELSKFMHDTDALDAELVSLDKQLEQAYPDSYHAYTKLGRSMATMMITGTPTSDATPNSMYNLVNLTTIPDAASANTELATELLNKYVSLNALVVSEMVDPSSVTIMAELIDADPSGVANTLMTHNIIKEDALNHDLEGQASLLVKGFTKDILDGRVDMVVTTEEQADAEELLKRGYVRDVAPMSLDNNDKGTEAPLYMYVHSNGGNAAMQSGIINMGNFTAAGSDLFAREIALGNTEDARIESQAKLADVMAAKAANIARINTPAVTSTTGNILVPVTDGKGNVVSLRYMMSTQNKREIFKMDESFENVMGAMAGSTHTKTMSPSIKSIAVIDAKKDYDENYAKEPNAYIQISHLSRDPRGVEIAAMLPEDVKNMVQNTWGSDGMYIHESVLKHYFGERKFSFNSLRNKDLGDSTGAERLGKVANNTMNSMFNNKYGLALEGTWQEIVNFSKDTIVVRSIEVLMDNIVSNTLTLAVLGINPINIARYQKEAFVEARKFQKNSDDLYALQMKARLDPTLSTDTEYLVELRGVENELANSPVRELMEQGVYQSIADDLYMQENSRIKGVIDTGVANVVDRVPLNDKFKAVSGTVIKHATMQHGTPVYEALKEMTQLSDFMARYALHKHNTENGMQLEDSVRDIVETFIDYDTPTNMWLQYANDMGMYMFTKYWLRNQRIIAKVAKDRPASAAILLLLNELTGAGLTNIFDSTLIDGKSFNDPVDVITGGISSHPLFIILKSLAGQ